MDRSHNHILVQVIGEASSTKGVATTVDDMMGLEADLSGGSRSTSLAKRECYIFIAWEDFCIYCS